MTERRGQIVLATGGTGGHVFPARALAAELMLRGHAVAVVTDMRGSAFENEIRTWRIRAATLGGSPAALVRGTCEIGVGTLQAWRLLGRLRPSAVVGFGSYASLPTMVAAGWCRTPSILHEQNAVLGRANRYLAGRVDRIATSFPEVEGVGKRDRAKLVLTGNPVRAAVSALGAAPYAGPKAGALLDLLVVGGSQGARVFSEVVPAAIARLPEAVRARIRLVQQCRPEDIDGARRAYEALGFPAELSTFFDDMPARLADAHLVVARAGASTVAELTASGRPAILVPYPHATDDHQTANAQALDEAGAAWIMPQQAFGADSLAARLETAINLPTSLEKAAAAARALGHPDAARALADVVEAQIAGRAAKAGRSTEIRSVAA